MSIAATRTKAGQSERTRQRLLRAAQRRFASNGYAGASLEEIAAAAKVTTGAIYHQFGDKKGLFRAVLERMEVEVVEKARSTSRQRAGDDKRQTIARLGIAAQSLLDDFTVQDFAQIVIVDGPAVLGLREWQELSNRHLLAHLVEALESQMALGHIDREPAEPLALVLIGALTAAGTVIAYASDKREARERMGSAISRLLQRLEPR